MLEARVHVPSRLGVTFEALRPAVERLARVRPLHRELTPEALHAASTPDDLTVVVSGGEVEASVRPAVMDPGAAALDRERLERELAEAETWLEAARARLANGAFMSKAPPSVVEGARAREAELAEQVARLRERLGP
jgi:valyl-tRNA synthetase